MAIFHACLSHYQMEVTTWAISKQNSTTQMSLRITSPFTLLMTFWWTESSELGMWRVTCILMMRTILLDISQELGWFQNSNRLCQFLKKWKKVHHDDNPSLPQYRLSVTHHRQQGPHRSTWYSFLNLHIIPFIPSNWSCDPKSLFVCPSPIYQNSSYMDVHLP